MFSCIANLHPMKTHKHEKTIKTKTQYPQNPLGVAIFARFSLSYI
jgi:hypothetical protein